MSASPLRRREDSGRDVLKIEFRKINTYVNSMRGIRGSACG
jgi:hypothetical protein